MFLQDMILHGGEGVIETGWLLLDDQYISDIFSNTNLVKYIRHSKGALD